MSGNVGGSAVGMALDILFGIVPGIVPGMRECCCISEFWSSDGSSLENILPILSDDLSSAGGFKAGNDGVLPEVVERGSVFAGVLEARLEKRDFESVSLDDSEAAVLENNEVVVDDGLKSDS